ncbi:hypothetical protein FACS189413_03290 [Bacteroidia bacterium]|nr:hypothetical protein FACS189413_03290 [Bacteroidia bacterium]
MIIYYSIHLNFSIMKKSYIFIFVLCLSVLTAMATPKQGKRIHFSKEKIAQLKSQHPNVLRSAQAQTAETILFEDFSKFTAGSEAAPDAVDITDEDTEEIPVSYTQNEGWFGWGVKQAGGTAYIDIVPYSEYNSAYPDAPGYIGTPVFDGSTIATITFKARTKATDGDIITVYTNFYDEELDDFDYDEGTDIELTNQWAEYTVDASVINDYVYFDFWGNESEFYLDDVEITISEGGTNPSGNVIFYETFGEEGPTANPRATIAGYTDYDNGAPVVFSYTTTDYPDIRATNNINTHVWFPAAKESDLVISNIPAAGYSDLKLSFDVASNNASGDANKAIVEVNNVAVTVPSVPVVKQNAYVNSGNIAIPAANTIKLRFYYTAANNPTGYGYRLDNVKITGINLAGINNPSKDGVMFYVSGNTLLIGNLSNGSVVEIYNIVGAKVQSSIVKGSNIELNNLSKGIYIVRAGNYSQKIVF